MVPGKSRGEQRPAAFSRNMEVVKKGVTAVASAMEYISQAWGTIMDLARHFTLKDALDVAIVTLLLYSAIKLGDYNIGRSEQILTLPLYMAFLLRAL